jgi:hypothetical protein
LHSAIAKSNGTPVVPTLPLARATGASGGKRPFNQQLVSSSKKGCVFFIKNQEILGNLNIQIASIKKSIDAVNKITTF